MPAKRSKKVHSWMKGEAKSRPFADLFARALLLSYFACCCLHCALFWRFVALRALLLINLCSLSLCHDTRASPTICAPPGTPGTTVLLCAFYPLLQAVWTRYFRLGPLHLVIHSTHTHTRAPILNAGGLAAKIAAHIRKAQNNIKCSPVLPKKELRVNRPRPVSRFAGLSTDSLKCVIHMKSLTPKGNHRFLYAAYCCTTYLGTETCH
jgi:hypothetical protein